MRNFISQFANKLKVLNFRPRTYLFIANSALVFFLILFSNLNVLPLKKTGDFIFFTVLVLAFTLYRPGWAFLFFVGTVALENINLAPETLGIAVRPYQFFGGLTLLAILIKLSIKRLGFGLPRFSWPDTAPIIFAAAGFLSVLGATEKSASFKHSIVAASFVALYFLARIFLQNLEDIKKIIPFFLGSSAIAVFYGIWQNIRFMAGLAHFETMPGRPNATFAEPDWLGIYLVLLLACLYALIFYLRKEKNNHRQTSQIPNPKFQISKQIQNSLLYLLFTTCCILLILTVSRSAWLGAAAVTAVYLFLTLANGNLYPKLWQWKIFFRRLTFLAIAIIFSFLIIYGFRLTNFQLFNRLQSVGTGLQKITVSCVADSKLSSELKLGFDNYAAELEKFGCRHINLEEIEAEKAAGNLIKEIYREDPNISIRGAIFQKSWQEIKNRPFLGIGWENISSILGTDERGAGLNSSNVFLEVWLGSGILGITSFVLIWILIIIKAIKFFQMDNPGDRVFGLFLFSGFFALLIPNLFNAGVFLGILWLFFSISRAKK